MCFTELIEDNGRLCNEILIFLSTIKSVDWQHEREWRITMLAIEEQLPRERKVILRPQDVSRVFLGPRIDDAQEQLIQGVTYSGTNAGVFRRIVKDEVSGVEGLEGFETVDSARDLIYWFERAVGKDALKKAGLHENVDPTRSESP